MVLNPSSPLFLWGEGFGGRGFFAFSTTQSSFFCFYFYFIILSFFIRRRATNFPYKPPWELFLFIKTPVFPPHFFPGGCPASCFFKDLPFDFPLPLVPSEGSFARGRDMPLFPRLFVLPIPFRRKPFLFPFRVAFQDRAHPPFSLSTLNIPLFKECPLFEGQVSPHCIR